MQLSLPALEAPTSCFSKLRPNFKVSHEANVRCPNNDEAGANKMLRGTIVLIISLTSSYQQSTMEAELELQTLKMRLPQNIKPINPTRKATKCDN